MRIRAIAAALAACLVMGAGGAVEKPALAGVREGAVRPTLTPGQRGDAIEAFVRRWGAHVQLTYGTDVRAWASRLVPQFATGDATNLQRALRRQTFESAMAELDGPGGQVATGEAAAASGAAVDAVTFGGRSGDLVFTPITPCRLADTRVVGGPIAAGTNRGFNAWGYDSYAAWGGSNTDCGMMGESPAAVLLNVTAVRPVTNGYATVYRGDLASAPFFASINYGANAVVNNTVVVALNIAQAVPDFRIFSQRTSDYVIDIVGFYDAPHATALDCVTVISASPRTLVSGDRATGYSPTCPVGYTSVGGGVARTDAAGTPNPNNDQVINAFLPNGYWSITNNSGETRDYYTQSRCCRIPGR